MLALCVNKHGRVKVPGAILFLVLCSFLSDLWDAEFFCDSDRVCDCLFLCKQILRALQKTPLV